MELNHATETAIKTTPKRPELRQARGDHNQGSFPPLPLCPGL